MRRAEWRPETAPVRAMSRREFCTVFPPVRPACDKSGTTPKLVIGYRQAAVSIVKRTGRHAMCKCPYIRAGHEQARNLRLAMAGISAAVRELIE